MQLAVAILVIAALVLLVTILRIVKNLDRRITYMNTQEEAGFAALTNVASSLAAAVDSATTGLADLANQISEIKAANPDESQKIDAVTTTLTTLRDNLSASLTKAHDDHSAATGSDIPAPGDTTSTDTGSTGGDTTAA